MEKNLLTAAYQRDHSVSRILGVSSGDCEEGVVLLGLEMDRAELVGSQKAEPG